ncbi:MAG: hypothetical protein R3286_00045 [Gammaproteobacteria bacterium]|nr:hypothetical protein [Gammaproteobacteria bacterium]
MSARHAAALVAAAAATWIAGGCAAPVARSDLSAAERRDDLRYLATTIDGHERSFTPTTRGEFDAPFAEADAS